MAIALGSSEELVAQIQSRLTLWQQMVVTALVFDREGVRAMAARFGITPGAVSETYRRARSIYPQLPQLRRGRPSVTPRPFSQLVRNGSPDSLAFNPDNI